MAIPTRMNATEDRPPANSRGSYHAHLMGHALQVSVSTSTLQSEKYHFLKDFFIFIPSDHSNLTHMSTTHHSPEQNIHLNGNVCSNNCIYIITITFNGCRLVQGCSLFVYLSPLCVHSFTPLVDLKGTEWWTKYGRNSFSTSSSWCQSNELWRPCGGVSKSILQGEVWELERSPRFSQSQSSRAGVSTGFLLSSILYWLHWLVWDSAHLVS